MDKNTILNYVTETPGNTNRAVLRSMLDSIASSSDVEVVSIIMTPAGATLDKTYIEIDEAYKSGKMIFGKFIFGNNKFFGNVCVRPSGSENNYYFECVSHTLSGSGSINWVSDTLDIVTVTYDGAVTYESYTYNHS